MAKDMLLRVAHWLSRVSKWDRHEERKQMLVVDKLRFRLNMQSEESQMHCSGTNYDIFLDPPIMLIQLDNVMA